jgi:hypothetical protein
VSWRKQKEHSCGVCRTPAPPDRPAYHHYGYQEIQLFLRFVLQANQSLRGAAKTMQILLQPMPSLSGAPTANCGRTWLLRLGLHELQRALPQSDDVAWIVDHTVQIGTQKCFVILSVCLSQLDRYCPELTELDVVAIEPVEQSNADIVERQLLAATERTGQPRMIVSDGCRELKRGIAQFQERSPNTLAVSDIQHKAALLLKKALEGDDRWAEFNKMLNKTRQATQPSDLAHLAPVAQKTKARYMNMGPVLKWSEKMLAYLACPFSASPPEPLEVGPINIHFKWLQEYREDIAEWNKQIEILEVAAEQCRRQGYHRELATNLRARLEAISTGERSRKIAAAMLEFIEEQGAMARPGERLLPTSEALESLFSRYKHIAKQQSNSGFTSLVLAMAACVTTPTRSVIEQALSAVRTVDVIEWAREQVGATVQAKRRNTLGKTKVGTNPAQEPNLATG